MGGTSSPGLCYTALLFCLLNSDLINDSTEDAVKSSFLPNLAPSILPADLKSLTYLPFGSSQPRISHTSFSVKSFSICLLISRPLANVRPKRIFMKSNIAKRQNHLRRQNLLWTTMFMTGRSLRDEKFYNYVANLGKKISYLNQTAIRCTDCTAPSTGEE